MSNFVAFTRFGNLEIHAHDPQGATDTLCGCDGNDSHEHVGTHPATLPDNPKITCEQCSIIIRFCRRYTNRDFVASLRCATTRIPVAPAEKTATPEEK